MWETRTESVKRVVKLVDSVNHSARLFRSVAAAGTTPAVHQFAAKLREITERYEFELRTELTRLAVESVPTSEASDIDFRVSFDLMLEAYRQALSGNLTAHARAMITRQFQEMQRAYQEFASIQRAA